MQFCCEARQQSGGLTASATPLCVLISSFRYQARTETRMLLRYIENSDALCSTIQMQRCRATPHMSSDVLTGMGTCLCGVH